VDWHLGDVSAGSKNSAENFIRNIVRYGVRSKIVMHMGRFSDVVPLFKPNLFEMIFLDGCHTREAVMADIDMAKPLLAAGATMAFHDYSHSFPGVIYCVEKFAASLGAKVDVIQTLAVVKLGG
jgi:predicted O-methyltransferase YrrM